MVQIAFLGFAALTIVSALLILFTRNVMYAALGLFLTFLGVAALFVFMGADFLAVTQLLVYVGGVLVLIIFGIMLTHRPDRESSESFNQVRTQHINQFRGGVIALSVFGLLTWLILNNKMQYSVTQPPQYSTIKRIGTGIMTDYVLPFEIVGVLLLVGLVGAAYLAVGKAK